MDDTKMQIDSGRADHALPTTTQAIVPLQTFSLPIHGGRSSNKRNSEEMDKAEPQNCDKNQRVDGDLSESTSLQDRTRRLRRHLTANRIIAMRPRRNHWSDQMRQNAINACKRAELFLDASEREFRLPPLPPYVPGNNSLRLNDDELARQLRLMLPVATNKKLNNTLTTPMLGLLVPSTVNGALDADGLGELARAIDVDLTVYRHESPDLRYQNAVDRTLILYLRTNLSRLRTYHALHPADDDAIKNGWTNFVDAAASLDQSLAQEWLEAQPVKLLEERVMGLLDAQGRELGAEASHNLQLVIEPTRNWPELHPNVFAYMDRYRKVMGIVGIKPTVLKTVIDYFVDARSNYHAAVRADLDNGSSMARPEAQSVSPNKQLSQFIIDPHFAMHTERQLFLEELDRWIEFTSGIGLKTDDRERVLNRMSRLSLRDRPPMNSSLRKMLEGRGLMPGEKARRK